MPDPPRIRVAEPQRQGLEWAAKLVQGAVDGAATPPRPEPLEGQRGDRRRDQRAADQRIGHGSINL
jgi:hypothetical protein